MGWPRLAVRMRTRIQECGSPERAKTLGGKPFLEAFRQLVADTDRIMISLE